MGWLTDWDDLIHGTAIFGAAVPVGMALLLGWRLPGRLWIAVAGALVVPILWIFGPPSWPLKGSDDIVVAGLASAILLAVDSGVKRSALRRVGLRAVVWASLGWLLYPAWLAADGGVSRRLLIAGAMGFSIAAWSAFVELVARGKRGQDDGAFHVTPAVWVPPSIALAVLLEFGGSTQFAQSSIALAAAVLGVCLLLIWGRGEAGLRPLAAFWGMLSALLAWSGWLFAEIQVGAVLALVLCPVAALAAKKIPWPRPSEFIEQLWDGVAAASVAGIVIRVGWTAYIKSGPALGY